MLHNYSESAQNFAKEYNILVDFEVYDGRSTYYKNKSTGHGPRPAGRPAGRAEFSSMTGRAEPPKKLGPTQLYLILEHLTLLINF